MKNNRNLRPHYGQLGVSLLLGMLLIAPQVFGQGIEAMGDLNLDGVIDICDVQNGISTLLTADDISKTGDINGDAAFDIRDVQHIINSALKTASLYKVVSGVIDVDELANLEIRALSTDGLTTSAPVDPSTGAFSISLYVQQGWTMALLNRNTGATFGTFQFLIEDVLSESIPLATLSEGGEINLGILYPDADGILLPENDIFTDIDLTLNFKTFNMDTVTLPLFKTAMKGFVRTYTTNAINEIEKASGIYNVFSLNDLILMGANCIDETYSTNEFPFYDPPSFRTFQCELPHRGCAEWLQSEIQNIMEDNEIFVSSNVFYEERVLNSTMVTSSLLGTDPDYMDSNHDGIHDVVAPYLIDRIPSTINVPNRVLMAHILEVLTYELLELFENHNKSTFSPEWILEICDYAKTNGWDWMEYTVDPQTDVLTNNAQLLQCFEQYFPIFLQEKYPETPEAGRMEVCQKAIERYTSEDISNYTSQAEQIFAENNYTAMEICDYIVYKTGITSLTPAFLQEINWRYLLLLSSNLRTLNRYAAEELSAYVLEADLDALTATVLEEHGSEFSQTLDPHDLSFEDLDNDRIPDSMEPVTDAYIDVIEEWLNSFGYNVLLVENNISIERVQEWISSKSFLNGTWFYAALLPFVCVDFDGDGIRDILTIYVVRPGELHYLDLDRNGKPDWAQDGDGDGVANIYDSHAATEWDVDADGVVDNTDYDGDNDGIPTYSDAEPYVPTLWIH